jgi:hypothetical protein
VGCIELESVPMRSDDAGGDIRYFNDEGISHGVRILYCLY